MRFLPIVTARTLPARERVRQEGAAQHEPQRTAPSPARQTRCLSIDARFAVGDHGYVLFISYNDIFSAIKAIYFVDRSERIRDQCKIGHELAQGLLIDIAIERSDRIRFAFPLNEVHVLRIGKAPRLFGLGQRWLHIDA